MKRSTNSSLEKAVSLGTADGTTSRSDNAEQDEADLTGSAETGEARGSAEIRGEARAQAYATGPALGATTAVPKVSNSPTHNLLNICQQRKLQKRCNSVRGRFIKWLVYITRISISANNFINVFGRYQTSNLAVLGHIFSLFCCT